ncbi:MAG: hypothetical protein ACI4HO_08640 [Ruminococcus sp.]
MTNNTLTSTLTSTFKKYYQAITEIEGRHRAASTKEEKEATLKERRALVDETKVSAPRFMMVYYSVINAIACGNEYIKVEDITDGNEVHTLIEAFKRFGVKKFVYASPWSNALEIAWLLKQEGYKDEGLIEVNNENHEKIHGILFTAE